MILRRISISNYKNIRSASAELSPKVNCLIGSNGSGKTNFLDAVHYLSLCRSAFAHNDAFSITHGEDYMVVCGGYEAPDGSPEEVSCGLKRGQKKRLRRNGKEYKRLSQHIGLAPVVFSSPADISLVEGAGEERRRFADTVVSQCDGRYIAELARYGKALQQRNALLRGEAEPDPGLMDVLEEEMAAAGEYVCGKRAEFAGRLAPVFRRVYSEIGAPGEDVGVEYVSHSARGPLLETIRAGRAKDRIVGHSLHGPHRDDLEMSLGGYPARRIGSQGQLKTFVTALRLAQFSFLAEASGGNTPIMLLDDIFDKLDAGRVERIVAMVAADGYGQIFITDTNRHHIDTILQGTAGQHKLFAVDGGEVTEV